MASTDQPRAAKHWVVEIGFLADEPRREAICERLIEVMQLEFPEQDPFVWSSRNSDV